MIILDDNDLPLKPLHSSTLGPTVRYPERVAGHSSLSLPDYETSQAEHIVRRRKSDIQKRVDVRFWKATLYAMFIYVTILSAAIYVLVVRNTWFWCVVVTEVTRHLLIVAEHQTCALWPWWTATNTDVEG